MRRFACGLLLTVAGCGSTTTPEDLGSPDLTAPARDLTAPRDASVGADLATPPDLAPEADLPVAPDLAAPADLAVPLDLVTPADQTPPADLTPPPDLAPPPDLTPPRDLAPPPDLTLPPDLAATCMDGLKNGGETDVDCGGPKCAPCALGKACAVAADCATQGCCGNRCVDLGSLLHCGACGKSCVQGQSCVTGACVQGELVAHYRFDENGGNVIRDSSGKGADGTHNAAYGPGKKGSAILFGGADFAVVPKGQLAKWGDANGDFTVEYWIRVTQGPTGAFRCVLHRGNNDMERTSGHWLDSAKLQINAADSTKTNYNDVVFSPLLAVDQWVHFAVVKQGNTRTAYTNGVKGDAHNISDSLGNDGPLYLGKDLVWPGMHGYLDDLRIYTRALSAAEIMADMQ